MKKSETSSHTFIDPVCLMQIEPIDNNITSTYQLRTYYFCAEKCRDAFRADPDRYIKSTPPRHKSWWSRYLDRLNKVTGGKPPKCCR